jgi:hypothetical protein
MTTDTMFTGMISGVTITVTISGKTTTEITSGKIFDTKRDRTWFLQNPSAGIPSCSQRPASCTSTGPLMKALALTQ